MYTLQELSCRCYFENSNVGSVIPMEIPGTVGYWLSEWMRYIGFDKEDSAESVMCFLLECLTNGCATKRRVSYSFRRRVELICDTIGINRGPHRRDNLSDVVITLDPGFVWKKKRVMSTMIKTWYGLSP